MYTVSSTMLVDRDIGIDAYGDPIEAEILVTISGTVQPAEPDVGISQPFVEDFEAWDENGKDFILSERETERAIQTLIDDSGPGF